MGLLTDPMTLLGDAGIGGPFTELLMQEIPKSLSFEPKNGS
jgi:hypothetical protein